MKKTFLSILCLISMSIMACSHENIPISKNELPQKALQFINSYFSEFEISTIFRDGNEYEVRFANGSDIEFTKKGEWKSVDFQTYPVPTGFIPEAILSYIHNNFAQNYIVEISRDHHGYDVELNNGIDLDFDKEGAFIRIDN